MTENHQKETRERILDSAEREFADNGFGGARIKEIAQGAGITGAMVHYYFQTKEELYRAVLDRMVGDLVELVGKIAPEPIGPIEKLHRFFYGFFDYAAKHYNFSRLTSMETGHDNQEYFLSLVREFIRPMFEDAREFLSTNMERGIFKKTDPDHLLTAIYGMTISYFSDSRFLDVVLNQDTTEEAAIAERRDALMAFIEQILLKG